MRHTPFQFYHELCCVKIYGNDVKKISTLVMLQSVFAVEGVLHEYVMKGDNFN